MYGTCETLCRALAAKYPGDTPLMLVIWSPEEIQALADGMDISLSDHEIRTVLARLEDIPEDQRTESGISSGAAMEIIKYVSENRQVSVPAELLASLIQTAEQALWKREWAARDNGLAVPECVTRRQAVVNQVHALLKNLTALPIRASAVKNILVFKVFRLYQTALQKEGAGNLCPVTAFFDHFIVQLLHRSVVNGAAQYR